MIRVNLLPPEQKKKVRQLPGFLITGIVILVVAVLVFGFFTIYLTNKVSDMNAEKTTKEKRLTELQAKIKEVKDYEKDNQTFQNKNNVIEQLRKNQNIPLRLLDEVSAMLPSGVWLTYLNESGSDINIEGYAFTNPDLVGYVENLKMSKYMTEVTLIESRNAIIENVSVYQFKLTFRIKV